MANIGRPVGAIYPLALGVGPATILPGAVVELISRPQIPLRLRRLVVTAFPVWEDVDPILFEIIKDAVIERDENTEDSRANYLERSERVERLWKQMPARQAITPDAVIEDIRIGNRSQLMSSTSIPASAFVVTQMDNDLAMDAAPAGCDIAVRFRSTAKRSFEMSAVFFANQIR